MSEHTPLTEAEREVLRRACMSVSPLTFVPQAVERILAARTSTATADTGHKAGCQEYPTGWLCVSDCTTVWHDKATADTGLRERVEGLAEEMSRDTWYWASRLRAVLDATPASTEDRADNEGTPCGCWKCYEARGERIWHMVLCAICGNKRCPHAADHDLDCTGSNATGQPGSAYEQGSGAATARRLGDNEGTR